MSKRKKIIASNEISKMYEFNLGGYVQKVLIEGKTIDLPVVINLHGGPGMPVPFSAGCRGLFPEYTDKYIMVYWDQLGCGININNDAKNMKVSNYVDMTIDLVHEIKALFPANKIVFFAISFGSVLSSLALNKEPNLVDGVLAWGQFINKPWLNNDVVKDMENHKMPIKKLERFKALSPDNFDLKKLKFMYTAIRKYTNGYVDSRYKPMPIGRILKGLLTSPDYKIRNLKTFFSNDSMLNIYLYKELFLLDEMNVLTEIEIPYLILSGESDNICTTKESLNKLMNVKKDNISIVEIKNTGHIPSLEAFNNVQSFLDQVINKI